MARSLLASLLMLVLVAAAGAGAESKKAEAAGTEGGALTPPSSAELYQFVAIGSLLCSEAPARDCIDHGWRFADANGDGALDLAELRALRSGFLDWAAQAQGELSGRDRLLLNLARSAAAAAPLATIFSLYDSDRDQRLSQQELLADIRLDARPLPAILQDPDATDWTAIRARLGRTATLLGLLGAPE